MYVYIRRIDTKTNWQIHCVVRIVSSGKGNTRKKSQLSAQFGRGLSGWGKVNFGFDWWGCVETRFEIKARIDRRLSIVIPVMNTCNHPLTRCALMPLDVMIALYDCTGTILPDDKCKSLNLSHLSLFSLFADVVEVRQKCFFSFYIDTT